METLSVVIPVYQGAETISTVVQELLQTFKEPVLNKLDLKEVILVHDGAVDGSAGVLQQLEVQDSRVKTVWLSRNYGQHAATLAGCASSLGDWICTMDEDGLHDPDIIGQLHAAAVTDGRSLAYAQPLTHSHKRWRKVTSLASKYIAQTMFGVASADKFSSFRLMDGYLTRALAAYCGYGVYLDVALTWVFPEATTIKVAFRDELRETGSGYSFGSLLSHFRRMVLTAGPRPLRIAAAIGLLVALVGILGSGVLILLRLTGDIAVPGWTSVMAAMSALFGVMLVVLGVIAEYLSVALAAVSGRPPYLITGGPPRGHRRP